MTTPPQDNSADDTAAQVGILGRSVPGELRLTLDHSGVDAVATLFESAVVNGVLATTGRACCVANE
jgi:hypothetical protein